MPDDYRISELTQIETVNDGDLVEVSNINIASETGYVSVKARILDLANKIVNGIEFSSDLETTSKKIIGAINELKAGGGGSTELIGTASGSIATFSDGGNNIPMKSCEVAIVAQQASGTPSPSNPLPITGFSSVALSVSDGVTPTTTNVSLGQTIYGGTAELVGGNGTKTVDIWNTLSTGDWSIQGSGDSEFFALSVSGVDISKINDLLCNKYKTLTPSINNTDDNIIGLISAGNVLRIRDKRYTASTINDFKSSLSDCVVMYPLDTPTTFTFTGANIPTLSGVNNVYADSGDVDLEYFNENADEIASMVRLMTRT